MGYRLVSFDRMKDLTIPIISSTYSKEEIQKALYDGFRIVFRAVEKNCELEQTMFLFQNKESLELVETTGREVFQQYGRILSYPESEWIEIGRFKSYGRKPRDAYYGAYLIPSALEVGTKVYLSDLIEDVVATDFWGKIAADDGFAVWNGEDLVLDTEAYEQIVLIG